MTMSEEQRVHARLRVYLNGKWDELDDVVKLALTVIASELDGLNENQRKTQRLIVWIGSALVTSLLSLSITLLVRL